MLGMTFSTFVREIAVSTFDSGLDQTTAEVSDIIRLVLPPDLCCGLGVEARLLQLPRRLLDLDLDADDRVID